MVGRVLLLGFWWGTKGHIRTGVESCWVMTSVILGSVFAGCCLDRIELDGQCENLSIFSVQL